MSMSKPKQTLFVIAIIALSVPIAAGSHGGAPGGGPADGWVDAHGDTMTGTLMMGDQAIQFSNGALTGASAVPGLHFAGLEVCVAGSVLCAGPPGPQGPPGSVIPVVCQAGSHIDAILSDGSAVCSASVTSVTAGTGLLGGTITQSGAIDVDTNYVQRRIGTSCTVGAAITGIAADGTPACSNLDTGAVYRYKTFETYDQNNWVFNNNAEFFGGITPSQWTDGNAMAYQLSSSKAVQRALFTEKGYAVGGNALISSDVFIQYSSTNGRVSVVLFRVENPSASAVDWTPCFQYTAYSAWGERASVTLNGANSWNSAGFSGTLSQCVILSIPPGRTSTVVVAAPSNQGQQVGSGLYVRSHLLAFQSNTLTLPSPLRFVDDLETATGGWEA